MGFASIARAMARVVSSPNVFGEEVTYTRAGGQQLTLRAVVERRPPGIEFAGAVGATIIHGSVLIRREDLDGIATGRDVVRLMWTDGALRTMRVVEVIDVSDGFWRLGVVT